MPLFDYHCEDCKARFERISSFAESNQGVICAKCGGSRTTKLLSSFAISGQGDLRESTMHGCHDCHVPVEPAKSGCGSGSCGHSH